MGGREDLSGPQFRADRTEEREAVRTTIVGGRPPGSGQDVGDIPRGLEVLIKKASVDADFRQRLLQRRAEAADEIGLTLDPSEVLMLKAVPAAHLEATIARTRVPTEHRRAFLGTTASAMLACIGLGVAGCGPNRVMDPPVGGAAPEREPDPPAKPDSPPPVSRGTRPDRILPAPGGAAPDLPPSQD